MVAVAADPRSGAAEQLQKAAGPTTYELRKLGKAIKQWHPRANPKGRDVWSDDVSKYMRTAIPIIPNYILEGPPTMKRVTTYWGDEPGNVHLQPQVHIAPGGFATVRFPAQGLHAYTDPCYRIRKGLPVWKDRVWNVLSDEWPGAVLTAE